MDVLAWVLSGLLAAAFLAAGLTKLLSPHAKLQNGPMPWVEDFSARQIKAIATLEILGAVGVILPWWLDIAPVLTPIAAVGLAIIMVGALRTHGRRGELKQYGPVNGVLLALAVAVAVIRFTQL